MAGTSRAQVLRPGCGACRSVRALRVAVLIEARRGAVVGLVDADDGDEPGPLQNAVRLRVAAAGADFLGVRIAADVQEAVGAR